MTEIVQPGQVEWGSIAITILGLIGLWCGRGNRSARRWRAASAILALVWPLWHLFEWIDRELDTSTLKGAAAPYVLFALMGVTLGWTLRPGSHAQNEGAPPGDR